MSIKILKPGFSGYGTLIEEDAGYISPNDKRNQSFISEMGKMGGSDNLVLSEPYYVYAVLQKYGVKNRNGRVYPEDVLVPQSKVYQTYIDERRAIGELEHPESSNISGDRVSHNIVEMWWDGNVLMGKLEILMSPGFIRLGIVSTLGDQVANLLRHKIRIGVSSRGVGSVEDENGVHVVQKDFELICWDIVTNPSTPGSWIFDKKPSQPGVYNESKIITNETTLIKGIDNFLLG